MGTINKILFYSTKDFEQPYYVGSKNVNVQMAFTTEVLSSQTISQAKGFDVVSIFTADDASSPVIEGLYKNGVKYIAIRAAGYDNVDLQKAKELGIMVANVPAYSPYAIAEHAVALILALNRKIITADKQVHNNNFKITNLVGFDLNGKTVGIIGTGRTGSVFSKIMNGFGCRLLAYDIVENRELTEQYKLKYVQLEELCKSADIISMHTCLTKDTKYIMNKKLIGSLKKGVMLINTSRGACVNTLDVIEGLQQGILGSYGADVYENERGIFFNDLSDKSMNDELLKRLLAFPNVLITPHQAFATKEALTRIAATTFYNIDCWMRNVRSENELTWADAQPSKFITTEQIKL
jgi:D-lactate dehydrogenase